MREAARNIRFSDKVKSACVRLFQVEVNNDVTRIPLSVIRKIEDGVEGEGRGDVIPTRKRVEIWQLDGEELVQGRVEVPPGKSVNICIYHLYEDRTVPGSELKLHDSSRGVSFSEISRNLKPYPTARERLDDLKKHMADRKMVDRRFFVVNVSVDRPTDAEGHKIALKNWEPRNCSPSRNIIAEWHDGERINMGTVTLPKEDKVHEQPAEGYVRKTEPGTIGTDGKRKVVSPDDKNGKLENITVDVLVDRSKSIPFGWLASPGCLGINKVGKYGGIFTRKNKPADLEKLIIAWYDQLNSVAFPLHYWGQELLLQIGNLEAIPQMFKDEQEGKGHDVRDAVLAWDVIINEVLEKALQDDKSDLRKALVKIEAEFADWAKKQADEV
jgi:hypothetical protein